MLRHFLFADDCALNASSEPEMQDSTDKFPNACYNFGLTVSAKKTKVTRQPAPGQPYVEPSILVKSQNLPAPDNFTSLGSTLFTVVLTDDEVICRLPKTSANVGGLRVTVWE